MLPLIAAAGKLNTTGSNLVRSTKSLTDAFDKYQKATLSIGVDYQVASAALSGSMKDLKGSLDDRFTPAFLTLKAGLGMNSAGVTKLVHEQKLTNIAFQNTAAALKDVQISTGMSIESLNALASTTTKAANKYFMSSDLLVKAIGDLKQIMPSVMLSGNTKMIEGLRDWMASLGPGMQETATRIANEFLSPEYEKMGLLSQLNIEHLREQIFVSKDAKTTANIMNKVVMQGMKAMNSFADTQQMSFRDIQSFSKVYGKLGTDIVVAANQLGKAASRREDSLAEAGRDFGTAMNTLKQPFEDLFMTRLMPSLLNLTQSETFNLDHIVDKVEKVAIIVGGLLDPKQFAIAMDYLKSQVALLGTEFKLAAFGDLAFFGPDVKATRAKIDSLDKTAHEAMGKLFDANEERLAELAKQTGILENIDEGINKSDIDTAGAGYLNMSQRLITDQIMSVLDPTGGGDPNAEVVFHLKIMQEALLKDKQGTSAAVKFGD